MRAGHKDEAIKWAIEARRLAVEHGQQELVAIIERDLARLKIDAMAAGFKLPAVQLVRLNLD